MFETERLRLRALEEEDFVAFAAWWNDPELMALQSTHALKPAAAAGVRKLFQAWADDSALFVTIVEKRGGETSARAISGAATPRTATTRSPSCCAGNPGRRGSAPRRSA